MNGMKAGIFRNRWFWIVVGVLVGLGAVGNLLGSSRVSTDPRLIERLEAQESQLELLEGQVKPLAQLEARLSTLERAVRDYAARLAAYGERLKTLEDQIGRMQKTLEGLKDRQNSDQVTEASPSESDPIKIIDLSHVVDGSTVHVFGTADLAAPCSLAVITVRLYDNENRPIDYGKASKYNAPAGRWNFEVTFWLVERTVSRVEVTDQRCY